MAASSLPPGTRPLVVRRPSRQTPTLIDVNQRVQEVIEDFDGLIAEYDREVPFQRTGQYERHRATIDRRRELGSARAAISDYAFTALLHATLQSWGIGRRGSRLAPVEAFRQRLVSLADDIAALEDLEVADEHLAATSVAATLDRLIRELGIVDNKSLIVAGTKTLHHLLPELVPPMDRRYTGAFFGWRPADPQTHQTTILGHAFDSFSEIARRTNPSRLVGDGWRTSTTKVLDNAVVAYCTRNGLRQR